MIKIIIIDSKVHEIKTTTRSTDLFNSHGKDSSIGNHFNNDHKNFRGGQSGGSGANGS